MSATTSVSRQERIKGALIGAFVGDALALGPHWYYDLDELRRVYGDWIDGYTAPQPGRYHAGLAAGASSQSGVILALTLQSLIDCGGYDEADFCRRLDEELFPQLDGNPMSGPGGYTSQSIRETWRKRRHGESWSEVAGLADNTEAAERVLAIAVRDAGNMTQLARHVSANVALTQRDPTVGAMTLAYAAVLGQLIQGEPLDAGLSGKLMAMVKSGELPFHTVTSGDLDMPQGKEAPLQAGQFASPDALLTVSSIASAVQEHGVVVDPAWKVSLVYGLPCAVYHQFPAAYHLAARFQDDFETAVLHAVNGGGQNMARAMLTGALCGAIGGFEAIPGRFVAGLEQGEKYLAMADAMVEQMA
ncbi:MAG TPA: ADP-ribosylglycohydrolase family protein [Rhodanobacteraceae bacterium]|nr:ADP-ribosylglycohydrolase family protein [Rhodanobacteraceae bacterium]